MKKVYLYFFILFFPGISNGQWTAEGKDKFLQQCRSSAATSFNKEAAGNYCNCMLNKISAAYSSESAVATIQQTEIDTLAAECVSELMVEKEKNSTYGAWWSAEVRKEFISSCQEKLKGSSVDGEKYCSCALDEMIILFPDPLNATNIKDADLYKIAVKCLGE